MKILEVKHNQALYNAYAIQNYPNCSLSLTAWNKHDNMIAKMCNSLPEGATELTKRQLFRRKIYLVYLLIMDIFCKGFEKDNE